MNALIQPFIDYLRFEKRSSAHTIRAYTDDLGQFFAYVSEHYGEMTISEISPPIIRSWLAHFMEEGDVGPRSINRKISSLRSFYKFQLRGGLIRQSPMTTIVGPKTKKSAPEYVKQDDSKVLFSSIVFQDDWEGRTERLILLIFYHTGMRLSELVNLKEKQVDAGNRAIKVLGKGNKERIIPIGDGLAAEIRDYAVRKREELEKPDMDVLLVGKKGKKLYPRYVQRVVKKYLAQETSLTKKSPHVLRHTFATHMLNGGAPLNDVKEFLGHASLAATQIYTHNTIEKLKDIHHRAHPKA